MIRTILIALALITATAHADSTETASRDVQLGLNMSTDNGPHRVRVGGGVRLGKLTLSAVLDPYGMISRRANHVDVLVEYAPLSNWWAALLGWRTSDTAIDRGEQWQHHLLVGASARLPALWDGRVRPSFGAQFVLTVVRHGDRMETDWVSFESDRHLRDTASLNLFARFEYVSAL